MRVEDFFVSSSFAHQIMSDNVVTMWYCTSATLSTSLFFVRSALVLTSVVLALCHTANLFVSSCGVQSIQIST